MAPDRKEIHCTSTCKVFKSPNWKGCSLKSSWSPAGPVEIHPSVSYGPGRTSDPESVVMGKSVWRTWIEAVRLSQVSPYLCIPDTHHSISQKHAYTQLCLRTHARARTHTHTLALADICCSCSHTQADVNSSPTRSLSHACIAHAFLPTLANLYKTHAHRHTHTHAHAHTFICENTQPRNSFLFWHALFYFFHAAIISHPSIQTHGTHTFFCLTHACTNTHTHTHTRARARTHTQLPRSRAPALRGCCHWEGWVTGSLRQLLERGGASSAWASASQGGGGRGGLGVGLRLSRVCNGESCSDGTLQHGHTTQSTNGGWKGRFLVRV